MKRRDFLSRGLLSPCRPPLGAPKTRASWLLAGIMGTVIALPGAAAAETISLNLAQSIEMARNYSYFAKNAADEAAAADYRSKEARGRFLPSLSLLARYSKLSEAEPGRLTLPTMSPTAAAPTTGAAAPNPAQAQSPSIQLGDEIEEQYSVRLTLEQPLFTGGALLNGYRAARAGAEAAEARQRQLDADLRLQTEEAYFRLLNAQEGLAIANQSLEVLEGHARIVEALANAGRARQLDLTEVRSKEALARAGAATAHGNHRAAHISFARLLGLNDGDEIELTEELGAPDPVTTNTTELYDSARKNNPDLAGARAAAEAMEHKADALTGKVWPTVVARFTYAYENPNQRYFPLRDEFLDSWDASLIMNWTIWDWGSNWYGSRAAQREAAIVTRNVDRLNDQIYTDVHRRASAVTAADQTIVASKLAVEAAETALRLTQRMFQLGEVKSIDVLDRETELTKARAGLLKALTERRMAASGLRRVAGITVVNSTLE